MECLCHMDGLVDNWSSAVQYDPGHMTTVEWCFFMAANQVTAGVYVSACQLTEHVDCCGVTETQGCCET